MVYEDVMQRANAAFMSGRTRDVAFRRKQLESLLRMYEENYDVMAAALAADLRRPKQEAAILEIDFLINDMIHTINNLDEWSKDEKVNIFSAIVLSQTTLTMCYFFSVYHNRKTSQRSRC